MTLRSELWRKGIHLCTLILPVWIMLAPARWMLRGLLLAFSFFLLVDLARLRWTTFGEPLQRRIAGSLRTSETRGLTSAHYLTAAACVFAWLLPRPLAAAALAVPIAGDAAAALCGKRFGRRRFGAKSLEGSVAFFLAGAVAGWVVLPSSSFAICVAAALAACVEALPLRLDDNLLAPLVCALVLQGLV